MKHLKKGRKFSRVKKQREAMLKIMLGQFLSRGKMNTTEAKAKELQSMVERFICQAKNIVSQEKKDGIAAGRLLKSRLPQNVSIETMKKLAEKFATRKSGFSRVIKKGSRRSDSAKLAVIEMVEE